MKLVIVLSVLPFISFTTAFMQSDAVAEIILINAQSITVVDSRTGSQTLLDVPVRVNNVQSQGYNVDNSQPVITSAQTDTSSDSLYFVSAPLSFNRDAQNQYEYGTLTVYNFISGQQTQLYEGSGVSRFELSPNATHAIITYLVSDGPVKAAINFCILTISNHQCNPVPIAPLNTVIHWIDNENFIMLSRIPIEIYRVNVNTSEPVKLVDANAWFIQSASPIPGTSSLLISAISRQTIPSMNAAILTSQLFLLDLLTGQASPYMFIPPAAMEYANPYLIEFSPDGRYFVYGGYALSTLIDFQSGQVIGEYRAMVFQDWFSDSSQWLATRQSAQNDAFSEAVQVNASTGASTVLATVEPFTIPIAP